MLEYIWIPISALLFFVAWLLDALNHPERFAPDPLPEE